MNKKPIFDINYLKMYIEGKALTDTGMTVSINSSFLYDDNQNIWIPNCTKYERADEISAINKFAENFENQLVFTKSVIKTRILETIKQFGRRKFKELKSVPRNCVVFNNAIVYVGTGECPLEADALIDMPERNFVQNNFNYFVTNTIPYLYVPEQEHKCPTIDMLFSDWVGEKNKDLLYEIIAYCMLPDYPLHRIFILLGSGRNGKSKFYEIIEKIIGKDNVTASDLTMLTETPFGVSQLHKKLVCYIGEADGRHLANTSILKRLSGGDLVSAQYKGKPLFEFRNNAKIIISTNTLPQMTDKSKGNFSRYIIVDFPKEYTGEIEILDTIPEEEYSALANICVQKLRDLLDRRTFTNEPSLEDKQKIYESKANPLATFLDKECVLSYDTNDYIYSFEFYDKYKNWANSNGYHTIKSPKAITSELHDKGIESERKDGYINDEKKRYYAYLGIHWKDKKPIDTHIDDSEEFTKSQIVDYYKTQQTIPKHYSTDDLIKILKKQNIIYEPKSGVYKLFKGGGEYG